MYSFYIRIILHCVYVPLLSYLLVCWWTSRLLPCPTLQYSCLGNPMDWGAWRAIVHGVTRSRIQLSTCTHTHTHTEYLLNKWTSMWMTHSTWNWPSPTTNSWFSLVICVLNPTSHVNGAITCTCSSQIQKPSWVLPYILLTIPNW